jgi:hypothetical protein
MTTRQRLIPFCVLLASLGLAASAAFADSDTTLPATANGASAVRIANTEDAAREARKVERRRLARLPRPTNPASAADYGS